MECPLVDLDSMEYSEVEVTESPTTLTVAATVGLVLLALAVLVDFGASVASSIFGGYVLWIIPTASLGLYVWMTVMFARALEKPSGRTWFRAWKTFFVYSWVQIGSTIVSVAITLILGRSAPQSN